jgi:hypothetical protein
MAIPGAADSALMKMGKRAGLRSKIVDGDA